MGGDVQEGGDDVYLRLTHDAVWQKSTQYCKAVILQLKLRGQLVLYPLEARSKEGNGNTLQYSCLENPVGRGAWWALSTGTHRVRYD